VRAGALVIRRAEREDIPAVLRIEGESFADPWTADSFESSLALDRIQFLVAEELLTDNGSEQAGARSLVGYVIALVAADEGEVADLAVAPAARRRGIGGLLLDRVSLAAADRGVRALYLEVRESNLAARRLYESRSFRPVGRRAGYYRHPPEDALLLRRDLEPT
jgi:ribosomal-protein-alanine N-acetyltransferase